MLDEIIDKYFNKQIIRHAYLLETEDYTKVIKIAKKILLEFNTELNNIEYLLESNNYPDLKIIEPDGQWIKKEQVANLKDEFKIKSAYNNKRIYIIKNAENLNKSSANTMLKFLEEPEENIIALLITNSKTKVLETIVSRCQYINLDSNKEKKRIINPESLELYNILEEKKQNAGYEVIKILSEYDDRNEIKNVFNELIYIYEQILLKKMEIVGCIEFQDSIDKYLKNNTIEEIQRKIKGIMLVIDSLEYNVNLKLLVDKLVLSMFGVE